MIKVRKSGERGRSLLDWLTSKHSFSFANYYDPENNGFRNLRVINQDVVEGGKGFAPHSHKDMEILSYVLRGAMEHKDSMGNSSIIKSGDFQRMTAGTGVTHSEYNHSGTDQVEFLQIWIEPETKDLPPSYEQTPISEEEKLGKFKLIASPDGRDHSITIHQNVKVFSSVLKKGQKLKYEIETDRHIWIQVIKGCIRVNEIYVDIGDGVAVSNENLLDIKADEDCEFLLFDLK